MAQRKGLTEAEMYEYLQYLQDISPSHSDEDDFHSGSSKSDCDFIPIGGDETDSSNDSIGFQKEVVLQAMHLHLPVRGHHVIEQVVVQDGLGHNLQCSIIHINAPKLQDLHRLVERELHMVLCGVASNQVTTQVGEVVTMFFEKCQNLQDTQSAILRINHQQVHGAFSSRINDA
ncbi:hypothetical protein PR048_005462 [Dryococelus australis]|uniref:Uncharacterized protein n=1 Tax=Dryococelus australis TaxID=614101 RepID=A0ABQ9I977_9NEOP|nr:hypothetical protein PR048_005462 [Dryococelus australis]